MKKHSAMLAEMSNGLPFDILYCKKDGELAEFNQVTRFGGGDEEKGEMAPPPVPVPADKRRTRHQSAKLSLIPFKMPNGEVRELYTRLILKFNGEDVVL